MNRTELYNFLLKAESMSSDLVAQAADLFNQLRNLRKEMEQQQEELKLVAGSIKKPVKRVVSKQ